MGGSTGMTREEAIERLAESYYDIGALGARWENEFDDARLPFREDARRIFDALGLTVAPPLCEHCKMRPATCFGRYDDMEVGAYACDVCCGHGCEDGRCTTVAPPPGEDAKDAEIARLREAMAAAAREAEHAPVPSGEHWLSPSREDATDRLTNMLLHAFAHGARAFGHPVAVAENEGRAMRGGVSPETLEGITDRADTILRTLGLVAVDPALVERVREAREASTVDETGWWQRTPMVDDANAALADAVLSQLSGGDR